MESCEDVGEVAKELGVTRRCLYKWRSKLDLLEPGEESARPSTHEGSYRKQADRLDPLRSEVRPRKRQLGQAGNDAFNAGSYAWTIRFPLRARAIQTARVWSSNYPYLAGAFFLIGQTENANRALQEMVIEAHKSNVYPSHGPPLGMAIANCDRVRPKLSPEDREVFDKAVEKLVQAKQSTQ